MGESRAEWGRYNGSIRGQRKRYALDKRDHRETAVIAGWKIKEKKKG